MTSNKNHSGKNQTGKSRPPTSESKQRGGSPKTAVIKMLADNRKARFDYTIVETFEAGLELQGSEVKALRGGTVNLKDAYVSFKNREAFLQNAHIGIYKASSYMNHAPERLRKLLLKAQEINKLERAVNEKGLTCVPLKMYFRGQWAKVEIALVKGKKAHDKRDAIKNRDADRELAKVMRK